MGQDLHFVARDFYGPIDLSGLLDDLANHRRDIILADGTRVEVPELLFLLWRVLKTLSLSKPLLLVCVRQ